MRVNDMLLGCIVTAGGIGIFISAMQFKAIPGQDYGAGTMPRAIAVLTVCIGLFMIGKALLAGQWRFAVTGSEWMRDFGAIGRALAVLLLIVFYIFAAPILGFVPTSFLVLFVAMIILGTNLLSAVLVAIVATILIQQSFGRLLLVPLPRSDFFAFLW